MRSIPQLSVVVPVYNGGAQLEQCLDALLASDFSDYEIIIVDDNSSDGSGERCLARGVEVIKLASRLGPAAARNCGAERARAELILFVDADVTVRRTTLGSVAAFFRERGNVAALFGSYDDEPEAVNFVSQYKNLLHHFVHQRSSQKAATFWAGCGAIRREAFEAVIGFDETTYSRPSIEDIELGSRLRRKGFTIVLDRDLQVKHLKRWTFLSLIRTDIFSRALPWSQLIAKEGGIIDDLNLRVSDRISAMLSAFALALLVLSYFYAALLAGAAVALTVVFLLNLPLQRFFRERRGVRFSACSFAMLVLYYLYSGAVFTLVHCSSVLKNSVRRGLSAAKRERTNDA
ncbi:MAG TPA: glycosyltransferase [Pyrinomonadaceae bacterium]|nr:glycosyltransferase [Pyrinomonadaceae bacterium]